MSTTCHSGITDCCRVVFVMKLNKMMIMVMMMVTMMMLMTMTDDADDHGENFLMCFR